MLSSAEPTARVLPPDRAADVNPHAGAPMVPSSCTSNEPSRLDGFREGRREGFDKGYAEGLTAGREQVSGALVSMTAALDRLESAAEADRTSLEQMAVGLALEVAEVILEREIEVTGAVGVDAMKRAMSMAIHNEPIVIHMNQKDAEELGEGVPARVTIVVDPTVSRGCADVHLGDGLVQIDPIDALARVREALR